ncbi:MAG TPA: TonB-dependent receptor [Acidobacteriaceae bacterium]|nr:TonB-dependent receptor [Acidobacteriaceae bacterium]
MPAPQDVQGIHSYSLGSMFSMIRGLIVCVLLALVGSALSFAADIQVQGKVVDAAGAAIPNAAVSLIDVTTSRVAHTTTGAEGQFVFKDVPSGPQVVSIEKSGFETFSQRISPGTQQPIVATLHIAALNQSVVVLGTVDPEAKPIPTREDVMLIPGTVRVLDRKQLDAAGPLAGGAQMLASTPGANVVGYGETGATKYSVILNGIQQGWAGEATSFTAPGSLGITYDGIPVADPATGLWQSATMPQNLVMQDLQVTYGPGQAADRWYTDVGGRVEFTPIQPTEESHLSVALTQGPWGQQNFAFVGNTGKYKNWSTVLGGGLGRGDDFRQAPDGFGNPTKDGSVFGKTLKTFSAGSIAFGVLYSKGGGYRPTVIPTTDVGLVQPNGTHFSQSTSGFYSALPYAAYNKYDTNEMFMSYVRENLFLSPSSTLENSTWFEHIRRFHRRNDDGLDQGAQVNEWNNPHSNIFGDRIGMSKIFPYNTVNFGGYLLHEIYNSHNLFYNPASGGNGAGQIVGVGSKFRSGYFQQDNVAFYAQDDFHPIPQVHIIPGVRVVGFSTSYSDQAQRDFKFAPGVISSSHCALYPQLPGQDPYSNVFGTPNANDQGSLCGGHESRSAVEPSIDASVTPYPWLTLYGGYDVTYRSPALGGGGGMFQSVNPAFYTLAKGAYSQGGVKVHFTNAPGLRNFIAGVNYFHLDYTKQEIDFETATGIEESGGGDSTYHGVNAFFDADPRSNLHFFLNFAEESANFSTYIVGGPSLAECAAQGLSCTAYNNLPVSYVPNVTLNTGAYYGIEHNNKVLVEPRLWIETTGSQHLWSTNTAQPTTQTMPAYTTVNLSFSIPISFEKQSFDLKVDMLNLASSQYNEWEYISSGGYLASLYPGPTAPSGYINAYPGAPRSIYGTFTYHF